VSHERKNCALFNYKSLVGKGVAPFIGGYLLPAASGGGVNGVVEYVLPCVAGGDFQECSGSQRQFDVHSAANGTRVRLLLAPDLKISRLSAFERPPETWALSETGPAQREQAEEVKGAKNIFGEPPILRWAG